MQNSFKIKIAKIKALFLEKESDKEKYELILEMGKDLPSLNPEAMIDQNRVEGCQSTTYLTGAMVNGKMQFKAGSDALISKGLAALLLQIYNNEPASIIIQNPPDFLKEVGLHTILSPLRASGFSQMYQKIRALAKELTAQ